MLSKCHNAKPMRMSKRLVKTNIYYYFADTIMTTMANGSVMLVIMFSYVMGREGINQEIDPQLDTNFQSIDNEDVYRQTKLGQYKYPVIFEPMRNIRLSISSYQVTTFVDLNPFFAFLKITKSI